MKAASRPTGRPRPGCRFAAASLVAVAVLAGGTGCSRTEGATTLDTAATERVIDKVIGSRIDPDVREVRCPEEIERGHGRTFRCRAVLAGGRGEVRLRVHQTDDEGDLDVELLDAVLDRTAVADDLRDQLVKTFERTFTVDCGDEEVVVAAPKSTFTCTAQDPAGGRVVTVRVVDAAGSLTYDVAAA